MSGAFGWGVVAGSAFVVGGLVALIFDIGPKPLGVLMGFGSGALIAAVAYELVDEAGEVGGGSGAVALGLLAGSILYLLVVGPRATEVHVDDDHDFSSAGSRVAHGLLVVPEVIVVVGSLLAGHGLPLPVVTAVFLCSAPEAIFVTRRLRRRGIDGRAVMALWGVLAGMCGVTAAVAYGLLHDANGRAVAFVLALAGGSLLAEMATELLPEGRELAGPLVGSATVLGFALVFALVELV